MEKIKTFELDRWSEPDEQHRVRHIGMADAKETFEKLEAHLKEKKRECFRTSIFFTMWI